MTNKFRDVHKESYKTNGFSFPLKVLTSEEALDSRKCLESHELATGGPICNNFRHKPHLLFPWVSDLAHHPKILDAVQQLIGPDILCWTTTLFIKEPGCGSVEWHRDSDYLSSGRGLEPPDLLTVWLAISRVAAQCGPIQFAPRSHTDLAIVGDSKPTIATLEPGEMSIHHCNALHRSDINASAGRRIALAIRYIPANVRQTERVNSAMLVRGDDRSKNFRPEFVVKRDMSKEAKAQHKKAIFLMLGKPNA
jgi:non-haem Fe2+, alpha-ketoglutarate-dependent halogenase